MIFRIKESKKTKMKAFKALNEVESEKFLEKESFPVAKRAIIKKKDELETISLKFPLVLKINPSFPVHKKRIGGVIVCKNLAKSKKAFEKLMRIARAKKNKNLKIKSLLAHQFISGTEFMLGIKKDLIFGHVLVFSRTKEIEKNVKEKIIYKILPISEAEIKKISKNSKIVKIIKKLQNLVKKYSNIKELDINPLIFSKKENKVAIADARIIFE